MTTADEQTFVEFAVCMVAIVLGFILSGWCAVLFWRWFVVPVFPVAALTFWQAVGLRGAVHVMGGGAPYARRSKDRTSSTDFASSCLAYCVTPLVLLGMGAAIHAWLL